MQLCTRNRCRRAVAAAFTNLKLASILTWAPATLTGVNGLPPNLLVTQGHPLAPEAAIISTPLLIAQVVVEFLLILMITEAWTDKD